MQVGGMELHASGSATIHACKFPCFWRAVGSRQPAPTEAHYFGLERPHDLYLNLIDSESARYFALEPFALALRFLDRHAGEVTTVHCNQGRSRAPTIALLWLARRGELRRSSYADAREAFRLPYQPSAGIAAFCEQNWRALLAL